MARIDYATPIVGLKKCYNFVFFLLSLRNMFKYIQVENKQASEISLYSLAKSYLSFLGSLLMVSKVIQKLFF